MTDKTLQGIRLGVLALLGTAVFGAIGWVIIPRASSAANAVMVPLELVLLVDTSASVDENEYELQKHGYADAFSSTAITEKIEEIGGIAVIYIEWDEATNQTVRIPWTHLQSHADCLAFSDLISAIARETSGTTMMAPALEFAKAQLESNDYNGIRRIIDVSGDGLCKNWRYFTHGVTDDGQTDPAHYGTPWAEVIAGLSGAVENVNGVYIGGTSEHKDFYEEEVPTGARAFVMQAKVFSDFSDTVGQKILRELEMRPPGAYD